MNLHRYAEIYKRALAPNYDAELESPTIVIEPFETIVDAAVKAIKKLEPNYFKGIRKIRVVPSSDYGHVKSGPNEDPTVINLNANRVKQELANADESEMVNVMASIIAHEAGHVRTFDPDRGFVGGEGPAEAEEKRILSLLQNI